MNLNKQVKKVGSYQLLEIIGKGANAIVYKGLNEQNARSVAIKQITYSQSEIKNAQFEIYILRKFEHENIVKYIDAIQLDGFLYIVLQYIEGGSLANLIKKVSLTQKLVKVYIKQVIQGLNYLHQVGVVHRDIKGANILITKQGIVKLADFGGAIRLTGDNKTFNVMGTPYWMSPQMIQNKGEISTSCDIWSLGCTMIELLTGKPPYSQLLPYPALLRIVQQPHPPIPEVSPQCKQFLLKCLSKQPSKRPKASELLHHAWLQDASQPNNRSNEFDVKGFLRQRNYQQIIKNLQSIINKKIIYTNPSFIQMVYDPENEDNKILFLLLLLKQDYECIQYFCSISLFNRIFSVISTPHTRINKLCAQMIYEILDACMKESKLSIFMSVCIQPLKKLFFLEEDKRCMKIMHRLFSQQIIPLSHLGFIVCKEGLLIRIFLHMEALDKNSYSQCVKCMAIVEKIASSKQPFVQVQYKPVIQTLVIFLGIFDKADILQKILRTLYNVSKHPVILQQLYRNQIVPIMLNYISILKKKQLKQELFQLYYYALKIFVVISQDGQGLNKLKNNNWKQAIHGVHIKEIIKKDIQDIYQLLLKKSQ